MGTPAFVVFIGALMTFIFILPIFLIYKQEIQEPGSLKRTGFILWQKSSSQNQGKGLQDSSDMSFQTAALTKIQEAELGAYRAEDVKIFFGSARDI